MRTPDGYEICGQCGCLLPCGAHPGETPEAGPMREPKWGGTVGLDGDTRRCCTDCSSEVQPPSGWDATSGRCAACAELTSLRLAVERLTQENEALTIKVAKQKEAIDWDAGIIKALLPYQDRAVKAEKHQEATQQAIRQLVESMRTDTPYSRSYWADRVAALLPHVVTAKDE